MCVEDECSSRDHFSRENRVAVIETLLAHGADPNSKDKVVHEKVIKALIKALSRAFALFLRLYEGSN